MEIIIDEHTKRRAEERGTSEEEMRDVVNTGRLVPAKYGREGKTKVFEFGKERHGKYYKHKRVEVVYTREGGKIITVTVYVFYGKWEAKQ